MGTTVALYPPGSLDLRAPAAQVGVAKVIERKAHMSVARLVDDPPAGGLVPGMRAVIIRPGSAKVRRRVAVAGGPPLDELKEAITRGGRDGQGSPYLEVVGPDDRPELSVVVERDHYVILDHQDQPLPRITPPVAVRQAGAARQLVQRLEHVVQYRNAWELHNEDESSALRDLLALSVERVGAGARAGSRSGRGTKSASECITAPASR